MKRNSYCDHCCNVILKYAVIIFGKIGDGMAIFQVSKIWRTEAQKTDGAIEAQLEKA